MQFSKSNIKLMACWVGPTEKLVVFYGIPRRPHGVKGLIEYNDISSKTSGGLWKYCKINQS